MVPCIYCVARVHHSCCDHRGESRPLVDRRYYRHCSWIHYLATNGGVSKNWCVALAFVRPDRPVSRVYLHKEDKTANKEQKRQQFREYRSFLKRGASKESAEQQKCLTPHVRLRWPCSEDEQPSNAGVPDRARISLSVLKFENPLVEISRSVRQRLSNIFVVQRRIFDGEFLTIRIRRQGFKHSPNRQSHSANTRLTVQDSGVARNSIKVHGVF